MPTENSQSADKNENSLKELQRLKKEKAAEDAAKLKQERQAKKVTKEL